MSQQFPIEINCPKCGVKQTTIVWASLNATVDPEAKQALLRGEINIFRCQKCHVQVPLGFPLMYHDMVQKYTVHYFPFEAVGDDNFLERFTVDAKLTGEESPQNLPKAMQEIVDSAVYMREPHIVFDLAELAKYVVFRDRLYERYQKRS